MDDYYFESHIAITVWVFYHKNDSKLIYCLKNEYT